MSPEWSAEPWDLCYLDCGEPGYRREWAGPDGELRYISLCPRHADVLERGAFNGDYAGSPLPADSIATRWPWRLVNEPVEPVAA